MSSLDRIVALPLQLGVPNVYGSSIMTLAGAPLTTLPAMSNGTIHFPSEFCLIESAFGHSTPAGPILNANSIASSYAAALTCSIPNGTGSTPTLIAAHGNAHSSLSLPSLQPTHPHSTGTSTTAHHHHAHPHHPSATSPYIFVSAAATSTSEEVCANGAGPGKAATLSSPSALYFYNNHHTSSTPTMSSADFLRL